MPDEARRSATVATSPYDQDHLAWIEEQAAHLRAGRLHALDVENLAEELDDMAACQRRELESRLEVIMAHLLKIRTQPERHTRGWDATIGEQRRQIARLFEYS